MAKPVTFTAAKWKSPTEAQARTELDKCFHCYRKPCTSGCPCVCSPMDFLYMLGGGDPSDFSRAAAAVYRQNPMGGSCGCVCPDSFCQKQCSRKKIDEPIRLPTMQAYAIKRARDLKVTPTVQIADRKPQKFAVVGAGPAGISAAAYLGASGYKVDVFEKEKVAGGACRLIPENRLPRDMLQADVDFWTQLETVHLHLTEEVDFDELAEKYDAVGVAVGLGGSRPLGVENEDKALDFRHFLRNPGEFRDKVGRKVVVVGGGPVSVDCATTARQLGADEVILMYRRGGAEMPITAAERMHLLEAGVDIVSRTTPSKILVEDGRVAGIITQRVQLPHRSSGSAKTSIVEGSDSHWPDVDTVVIAIGQTRVGKRESEKKNVVFGGDCSHGPSTVVQAAAGGKNMALKMEAIALGQEVVEPKKERVCNATVPGLKVIPADLSCDFFGRRIADPFILSASPLTDSYELVKKAFSAGWNGVVLKTAFDGMSIHVPAHYMNKFDDQTFGNCDNVSAVPLQEVCETVKRLVEEYPDRLVIASTGGPVTGNDEADKLKWQENTRMLEDAGAMAVEYSLSCPQGGDGSEGAIVSQNRELTAKVIGWVMEKSRADVPKLFKLTGSVTSVKDILRGVKAVLDKHPIKKAGVTLANSFPAVTFDGEKAVRVGMAGGSILPLTLHTLVEASTEGVTISANGGAMGHKASAFFLALGARTVQFCTLPEREGLQIVEDLREGLGYYLAYRGIPSVDKIAEQPGRVFATKK